MTNTHRFAAPLAFFFLSLGVCLADHVSSGPLNIVGQNNVTIENLHITSSTGTCIVITDSTNITIHNSEIGPCGASAVVITGGDNVKIVDNYIHAEVPSVVTYPGSGCCDFGDNISAGNSTNLLVQGNVIAYGETNIRLVSASTNAMVRGNFLLNPQDHGSRGQQVLFDLGASFGTVDSNYMLNSIDPMYIYPAHPQDLVNAQGGTTNTTVQNNYLHGGWGGSACGIIADSASDRMNINHNTILDTGECGIGIADGVYHVIDSNRVLNTNPQPGAGNSGIWIWKVYSTDPPCNNAVFTNNISSQLKSDGTQSGWWSGAGCDPFTVDGTNIFNDPATALLTPSAITLPPAIPPVPYSCAVVSPYTNTTSLDACSTTAR